MNTGEIRGTTILTSGGWLTQFVIGFTKTVRHTFTELLAHEPPTLEGPRRTRPPQTTCLPVCASVSPALDRAALVDNDRSSSQGTRPSSHPPWSCSRTRRFAPTALNTALAPKHESVSHCGGVRPVRGTHSRGLHRSARLTMPSAAAIASARTAPSSRCSCRNTPARPLCWWSGGICSAGHRALTLGARSSFCDG